MSDVTAGLPVVFVHGLWLHGESWCRELADYCLAWLKGKQL